MAAIFKSPWRREPHPIKSHFAWDQLNKTWLDGGQPADTDVALGQLYRFDKKYSMCTYMHCREFLVMTIFKLFFLFYPRCSISKAFLRFKPWMVYYVSSEYYIPLLQIILQKGISKKPFGYQGNTIRQKPIKFQRELRFETSYTYLIKHWLAKRIVQG